VSEIELNLVSVIVADTWLSSLISYFIDGKFHPEHGLLGTIMSVTLGFSAASNVFASAIAKRMGLIKTVHLSVLLVQCVRCLLT
jgi:hypothetical protein